MSSKNRSRDLPPLRAGDRLEATVEKVVFGGPGLCRTDRGVIFVDFAAAGDELEIEIVSAKKDYARGRILRIKTPSVDRTEARCPHFTQCGGCDWQHLSMPAQLKAKQTLVDELFERHLRFSEVRPILASPEAWNYRNRIQLHRGPQGFSYKKKRSHEDVLIQECMIAEKEINQFIRTSSKTSDSLRLQITRHGLESLARDESVFEFSQVNSKQNLNLIRLVLEAAEQFVFTSFLDLYAGAGNFSFPLAKRFPKVHGAAVELDSQLVKAAQQQIQTLGLQQRMQFWCGSVDSIEGRFPISSDTLILVDPPRGGMSATATKFLRDAAGPALLYVSCDPMTLVRDLKILTEKWKLVSVQPVDMFPQTSHIEILVALKG